METNNIISFGILIVIAIAIGVGGTITAIDKTRYTDYTTVSLGEAHTVVGFVAFNLNNKNVRTDLGSLLLYNATTPYAKFAESTEWSLNDAGESQITTNFSGNILANYTAKTHNASGISAGAMIMVSLSVLIFIAVILVYMIRRIKK